MNIEILNKDDCDPLDLITRYNNSIYPDKKIHESTDIDRFIRRIIRNNDILLQLPQIFFKITCSISGYTGMVQQLKGVEFKNQDYNLNAISFDIPSNCSDSDKALLLNYVNKLKLCGPKSDKKISLLPSCVNITCMMIMNFSDIFDMLVKMRRLRSHPEVVMIANVMFDKLESEFPQFFSEQNLKIHKSNKI